MKIDPNGVCIVKEGISLPTLCPSVSYGIDSDTADYNAFNLSYVDGEMQFFVDTRSSGKVKFHLGLPGIHNVSNALACIALLDQLGLPVTEIQHGLSSFKGVKRRFDVQIKTSDLIYIDDYAHHPEELKSLIDSLRMMYPDQQISAVFQPHLYSRTRDFGNAFSEQLSRFDSLIILPIYPAREPEIIGISSEWLLSMVHLKNKEVLSATGVLEVMKQKTKGVVVTIGAGDIGEIVAPLKNILIQNIEAIS
mgnify:FL=1